MTYPTLKQLRRMDLEIDSDDEVLASTFCETEQRLRDHLDDLRVVLGEFRRRGLSTEVAPENELIGDARFAWLLTYFAAAERGTRIGRERAERMIDETRRYAESFVSSFAPWLGDADD